VAEDKGAGCARVKRCDRLGLTVEGVCQWRSGQGIVGRRRSGKTPPLQGRESGESSHRDRGKENERESVDSRGKRGRSGVRGQGRGCRPINSYPEHERERERVPGERGSVREC
jgi:hypothetical protein